MKLVDGIEYIALDDAVMGVFTGDSTSLFQGIIKLNKTGYAILQYLEQGCSLEEIAKRICSDFEGINYDGAYQSVKGFADKLIEKGILLEDEL